MKPSQIDDAVQNICLKIKDYTIFDVNTRIAERLGKLHNEWIANGDIFALLEANYLVDYYCSHLVNYCDSNNRYNARQQATSPTPLHKQTRRYPWKGANDTYEVFRESISYTEGFLKVKRKMLEWRKKIMNEGLAVYCPDQVISRTSTAYHIDLDWKAMLQRYDLQTLLDAVTNSVNDATTYHASVWGMYRVVNLNNFDTKFPSSCITNSLIILSMLYMTGFPRDNIATFFQAEKNTTKCSTSKKATHWAAFCTNPYTCGKDVGTSGVIKKMDTVSVSSLWSTQTFKSYTLDILRYFALACQTFQYSQGSIDGNTRGMVLADFEWKCKAVLPP